MNKCSFLIFFQFCNQISFMKNSTRQKEFQSAAIKMLSKKGYKAMTMRELAYEMDCEVSNLYNFVKSKQAILDRVLFEISNKFHEGIENIESSSYNALEQLKAIVAMHVQLTIAHPQQIQLLSNEWKHLEEKRKQEFMDLRESYEYKLKSILQKGLKEKSLAFSDIDFTMNCVLSSIRWIYDWYSPEKNINPVEVEKNMIDFIFKGIQKL